MLKLITDSAHYSEVLALVPKVKRSLWIGTADIKDLYVKVGSQTKPFLALLAQLIKKGVEIRLIHAKEPGPAFREDFDKYPALFEGLERALCPRVHFKILVFDGQVAYIGSANLTGAGIGMKGDGTRNFEAGILTDNPELVEQAMNQFDDVWIGKYCKNCKRKEFCGDPIGRVSYANNTHFLRVKSGCRIICAYHYGSWIKSNVLDETTIKETINEGKYTHAKFIEGPGMV